MMKEEKIIVLILCGLFLLLVGFCVLVSRFQADAYNRLTGARITIWDAMWLDLPVVSFHNTNTNK